MEEDIYTLIRDRRQRRTESMQQEQEIEKYITIMFENKELEMEIKKDRYRLYRSLKF
jgi:hypothetical protein